MLSRCYAPTPDLVQPTELYMRGSGYTMTPDSHKCEVHSTVFHGTCTYISIIWHLGLKNLTASLLTLSIHHSNNNNNNNDVLILIIGFCCKHLEIGPSQVIIQQNKLGGGSLTNLYFPFDTGGFGLLRVNQMGDPGKQPQSPLLYGGFP